MPVKKMELLERASMHVFSVECITTWVVVRHRWRTSNSAVTDPIVWSCILLFLCTLAAMKIFHSTVATAAQLALAPAVHRWRLEWVRRQLDPPATFLSILSRNVQLSTNDGAFARRLSVKRYAHDRREKFATPKSIFFTCPNISHVWKLEKTDNDNAKQQKER